jgi:hypothetical protein
MSEVKVNKISPRSGTTVTLGDSGDTFTIPSGATINNQGTATNFGATGSASWTTTVKTSTFTAVAGEGYFVNTTGGAVTVNLPAGTAGAVVAVKDYANTFDTNAVTLVQNGSDKIGGSTVNATLSTEGIAVTLVFIDSTQGWLVTDSGLQDEAPTKQYVVATGGTITTCGNFKIHSFTGPGTFCVSAGGNVAGSNTVSYMVVAGGGSGGQSIGGGGGAGGFREGRTTTCSYTVSPLNAPAGLPISVQGYPITIGAGAAGATPPAPTIGLTGSPSTFSSITSAGGGFGSNNSPGIGGPGGSGGGASGNVPGSGGTGGTGNTPPVSPAQGTNGGNSGPYAPPNYGAGGGGGATVAGTNGTPSAAGAGGAGATTHITGSPVAYAGGGGGSVWDAGPGTPAPGGTGGGGAGGDNPGTSTPGTANTGGGGGGGDTTPVSGAGGSGIVIIRYKFQN